MIIILIIIISFYFFKENKQTSEANGSTTSGSLALASSRLRIGQGAARKKVPSKTKPKPPEAGAPGRWTDGTSEALSEMQENHGGSGKQFHVRKIMEDKWTQWTHVSTESCVRFHGRRPWLTEGKSHFLRPWVDPICSLVACNNFPTLFEA